MVETFGLALLATFFTLLFITMVIVLLLSIAYTYDHWDECGDTVKALIAALVVFLFWLTLFSIKAHCQKPVKAEVEDVRAS